MDPTIPPAFFAELYDQLRCGMFHQGITKAKVIIAPDGSNPIEVIHGTNHEVIQIRLVPVRLIDAIRAHLTHYVRELRKESNGPLRANFERWFNARGA